MNGTIEGLVERLRALGDAPGYGPSSPIRILTLEAADALEQMTTSREPQRESFEKWARRAVGQPSFAGKYVRDGVWSYNHNIVEQMWQCWRAALTIGSE